MPWQELTFELTSTDTEVFEDALLELGALSVTLRDAEDQPLMEPAPETTPLWDKLLLTAMFDMDVDIELIKQALSSTLKKIPLPVSRVEVLQDQEWRRTWMEHFKPMQFGQRLWICPSGYERPGDEASVVIDLDPGLAFGTGSHPTTALCMQWLDAHEVKGKIVIDYGCGSGILAIAAARLGAKRVIAVDNDPQALQATRDNAQANQVAGCIEVYLPDEAPTDKVDILIANILLEPLIELAPDFSRLLKPAGDLLMSGVLETQKQQLELAYRNDFDIQGCEQLQEWVRLDAARK